MVIVSLIYAGVAFHLSLHFVRGLVTTSSLGPPEFFEVVLDWVTGGNFVPIEKVGVISFVVCYVMGKKKALCRDFV